MFTPTTAVHSLTQYPDKEKSTCFGGIAILSVYSKPSSITPASMDLRVSVTWNLTPLVSMIPEI